MRNIDKKYHYLYKTTNLLNGKYYYGIHSTNNIEDNYLGSGKHIKYSIRKYGQENFKKEILEYFNTREELALAENLLITKDMLVNKQCMNIMYGGEKFNTIGMVSVKDNNGNYFKVFNDDPRYLSGELVFNLSGFINVKDKNDNILHIKNNDPRYLSGELVGITTGKVSVKDKDGNTYQVSINDTRYLSGELIACTKNTITVKDKNGVFSKVNIDNEKYLNGELVHMWTNKKHKEETKNKISISCKGKQKGELNSQFGTCWITKDTENKKIKKEELDNYLSLGWIKGRITK